MMTICLIDEWLTKTNVAVLFYCNTIKDESICTTIKSADINKSRISFQPFFQISVTSVAHVCRFDSVCYLFKLLSLMLGWDRHDRRT